MSDWEGEFIESVEGSVQTYGRAFADPEKGAPGDALSILQSRKLKEIATKADVATKTELSSPAAPEFSASPKRMAWPAQKTGGWRRKTPPKADRPDRCGGGSS